jgi:hypothetical protein
MESEEPRESWADSSTILFAAIHAGLTVNKIRITKRQVQIETKDGSVKIKKKTYENYTVSDLIAYLKRKLT